MRAGALDRQITIQERTAVQAGPQVTYIWAALPGGADIWAMKREVRGGEVIEGLARQAEVEVMFKIRWLDGVKREQRVIYEGAEFNILHVVELGRREGLELYCKGKPE